MVVVDSQGLCFVTLVTGTIFVVRQMQEKFRAKGRKLYFGFVDLQKAFDRVPREDIRWAMHKLGVEEWLISAVMSMYTGEWQKVIQKAVKWPCGVCRRGVGNNSTQFTSCQKWVHRKCSGIKSSMYKVMKTFVFRGCVNSVTDTGCTSIDIGVNASLELVDKFC